MLGAIWSAAPVLFFDASEGDHLVVACVSIGMLCGGAFALAVVPAAVLAFTIPLAAGCLFGLVHGARDPTQYFVVLLVLTYIGVLLRAALSHPANSPTGWSHRRAPKPRRCMTR